MLFLFVVFALDDVIRSSVSLQDASRFRHESHHPSAVKHTPHSLRIPSIPGSGSPDWLGVVACTDGNDALVALLECDI